MTGVADARHSTLWVALSPESRHSLPPPSPLRPLPEVFIDVHARPRYLAYFANSRGEDHILATGAIIQIALATALLLTDGTLAYMCIYITVFYFSTSQTITPPLPLLPHQLRPTGQDPSKPGLLGNHAST